jgi:hypothetical protein
MYNWSQKYRVGDGNINKNIRSRKWKTEMDMPMAKKGIMVAIITRTISCRLLFIQTQEFIIRLKRVSVTTTVNNINFLS